MTFHVAPNPIPAITADSPASSGRSFEPIQSLTEKEEASSEYFTRKTLEESEIASPSGSPNIERGKRRSAWEAGIKEGHSRVMQSPILESLCAELSLLRKLVNAMTVAAQEQDKVISWYRRKLREAYHHILTRRDP